MHFFVNSFKIPFGVKKNMNKQELIALAKELLEEKDLDSRTADCPSPHP